MYSVSDETRKPIFEGVQGENEAREIQFDVTAWVEELGEGVCTATAKRPTDTTPYPVTVTRSGNVVTWKPNSVDTAIEGVGAFQLEYSINDSLAKTRIWNTKIAPSLDPAGDPPDPYDNWLAEMREIEASAIQAAEDAEDSADAAAESAFSLGSLRVSDIFEVGAIYMTYSGWSYMNSGTRARTKKGVKLHIRAGATFGLTDYTNARYIYEYYDGSYHVSSWKTTNTTFDRDIDIVVTISNLTEVEQSDAEALGGLFFGYSSIAFDSISENKDDILEMSKIPFDIYDGYINSGGGIGNADATRLEKHTSLIPYKKGYKYNIELTYNTAHSCWLAYALYDKAGGFLSRTVQVNNTNLIQYSYLWEIDDDNAEFIALTFAGYGDVSSITVTSINNVDMIRTKTDEAFPTHEALVNQNIRSIAHRGYSAVYPENTLTAFKMAKSKGFNIVETDINWTSDGVPVCIHDGSINRTARNPDGTSISDTTNIYNITLEEAKTYDFGIWKGAQFAGTKIPTFVEFLTLCRNVGLEAYIELKDTPVDNIATKIAELVTMVKRYGMKDHVTWVSFDRDYLSVVKSVDSTARLGFVASVSDQTALDRAVTLLTGSNEVFVDANNIDASLIDSFVEADIGLEKWTIDYNSQITPIDPYVTGFTSNAPVASYVLYKKNI